MDRSHVYAVILAGGSGTRFWPLSRELYPKQLLKLTGPESMLQRTLRCALKAVSADHLYVATQRRQADAVRMQAHAVVSLLADHLIVEPEAKNTAAAIGLAAVRLIRGDPEAIMVVMPADHVIQKRAHFIGAVKAAVQLAGKGWLLTLGVKPHKPETGYGYIKAGTRCKMRDASGKMKIYEVEKFVEKPNRAMAEWYLTEGGYYWNSGIFIWKASSILQAIEELQPKLYRGLISIQNALGTSQEERTMKKVYDQLNAVSIDYGVLEKLKAGLPLTHRSGLKKASGHSLTATAVKDLPPAGRDVKGLAVVPTDMGWSDVGTWTAIEQISRTDSRGNVTVGNVIDLESRNSILYADKRLVATIGLSDLVVVDTEDATLICHKDRVQDVRRVVEVLKKRDAEEHRTHRTVWKPWGSFTVLENGDRYKIKRIVVNPKARLSLQLHHRRSEHWVVVAGTARVTCGKEVFDLKTNQSTYIPKKTKHRLENPGSKPLQIIEVQNGDYLGEDDIVRFQDDYGRGAK